VSLLRKDKDTGAGESTQAQRAARQQKAAERTTRMAHVRKARTAVSAMRPPEAVRGIFVGVALLGIAAVSWFSRDVVQSYKTVHGKSKLEDVYYVHPGAAVLFAGLVLLAVGTVYFRKRIVTVIAFMVAAAIGIDVPLPSSATDLRWVAFAVPAGYSVWVWYFRMQKDQKAWIAANPMPGGSPAAAPASRSRQAQRGGASKSTASPRKSRDVPAVGLNGRALPTNTGRYTQPRAKSRAGQRRP
jgi:hypothetical protein